MVISKRILYVILWVLFLTPTLTYTQTQSLEYKEGDGYKYYVQTIKGDLALIKIYSKLELTFDNSRKRIDTLFTTIKNELNEYNILVTHDFESMTLTVNSKGFPPLTIPIKGIGPKAYKVFYVEEKLSTLNLGVGDLELTSKPSGADIQIEGQPEFKERTPFNFIKKTALPYRIKLSKPLYYDVDTVMLIEKDNKKNLEVKLRAKFGYLQIHTNQANELFIDGIKKINLSQIQVPEGTHALSVKRKYFQDYNESIKIVGSYQPMIVEREIELEPYKGILNLKSEPLDANVYLDGKNIGFTPLTKVINAGQHSLELRKDNYRNKQLSFEIQKDETINKSIRLEQNGILKIVGLNYTEITINNQYRGRLPDANYFELPPGKYEVQAELEGYDSELFSFNLESETKIIELNLSETEGKFFRFCVFGNERLSIITPKWSIYFAYKMQSINPSLLSTAAKYPFYKSAKNLSILGGGLNLTLLPFSFETDLLYVQEIKTADIIDFDEYNFKESSTIFKMLLLRIKGGFCPFVLFERIYPFIGIMSQIASVDFQGDSFINNPDLDAEPFSYTEPGFFANVTFRLSDSWMLAIGYEKFQKKDAFDNCFYVNLGIYL